MLHRIFTDFLQIVPTTRQCKGSEGRSHGNLRAQRAGVGATYPLTGRANNRWHRQRVTIRSRIKCYVARPRATKNRVRVWMTATGRSRKCVFSHRHCGTLAVFLGPLPSLAGLKREPAPNFVSPQMDGSQLRRHNRPAKCGLPICAANEMARHL